MRRLATVLTACALAPGLAAGCSSSGGSKAPAEGGVTLATVSGGTTKVTFDPSFLTKVAALKVTPKKYGTATVTTSGTSSTITLPITSGKLTVGGGSTPSLTGSLTHRGSGLELTGGSSDVVVDDLTVDPSDGGKVTGEVLVSGVSFSKSLALFDVDDATISGASTSTGRATVPGVTLYVDPAAANALNLALGLTGSTKLPTGRKAIKVGTATITATGS